MEYYFAGYLIQSPPHGLHLVSMPWGGERLQSKEPKQVIGKSSNPKEHGIGLELPAGHSLHAEADLQFLDPVFTALTSLVTVWLVCEHTYLTESTRFFQLYPAEIQYQSRDWGILEWCIPILWWQGQKWPCLFYNNPIYDICPTFTFCYDCAKMKVRKTFQWW